MRLYRFVLMVVVVVLGGWLVQARETEQYSIPVLPAAGAVTVDGLVTDWNLSGGVFVCGDVEMLRERSAVWLHAMYDPQYLYVLARWVDETPLNNPGVAGAAHPFDGDCLQLRFVTAPGTLNERVSHWNCWQDQHGTSAVDVTYGRQLTEGTIADALAQGVRQAFRVSADKRGYVQELAIPWRLLVKEGPAPVAGAIMHLTVQPNFTLSNGARYTTGDLFQPGMCLEKTAAFIIPSEWGTAELMARAPKQPRPVRLDDGRTFPVRMRRGVPEVDWRGLTPAIRVACVGDSITFGYGIMNADYNSYPAVLGRLLGPSYQVGNFGRSGATLLKHGDLPYWQTGEFAMVTDYFSPNVVVIMLGTNDGKPSNWRLKDEFAVDYRALIAYYRQLPSKPSVWVCAPVPVYGNGAFGIQPAVVNTEIAPLERAIAAETGAPVIDVQAALTNEAALVPDNIHPDAEGQVRIANTVYARLRQAPAIVPLSGTYAKSVTVTLSSPAPTATLYYTLDDTQPTPQSPRYTRPLTLTASAVLRVLAVTPDDPAGLPASAVFTIGRVK